MPDPSLIPLSVVAGLTGAVLHEITHYTVARLMGREAHVDLLGMDTYYQEGQNDVAIRVAPTLLGSWAFLVLLAMQVSVPVWFAWGVYTLGGVTNDLTNITFATGPEDGI
jgi:membrane protein DedA with SNARE-associated domain